MYRQLQLGRSADSCKLTVSWLWAVSTPASLACLECGHMWWERGMEGGENSPAEVERRKEELSLVVLVVMVTAIEVIVLAC